MELVNFDDETVTIRMSRRDEFRRLFSITATMGQEYDAVDQVILNMSKEEVGKLKTELSKIMQRLF